MHENNLINLYIISGVCENDKFMTMLSSLHGQAEECLISEGRVTSSDGRRGSEETAMKME